MFPIECHPRALEAIPAIRQEILSLIARTLAQLESVPAPAGIVIVSAGEIVPGALRLSLPLLNKSYVVVMVILHEKRWLLFYAKPISALIGEFTESEIDDAQNAHIELIDIVEKLPADGG